MNAPLKYRIQNRFRHFQLRRRFAEKTAFVLNHNARAVTPKVEAQFRRSLPAGDLFVSMSLEDAQNAYQTIMERGYGRIMVGGGDGTLMDAIGSIEKLCDENGYDRPSVGVVKLGTGNALAAMMGSKNALKDAIRASKGEVKNTSLQLIRTDDGKLTPFAGVGWDGDVINDYNALKKHSTNALSRNILETRFGYFGAVAFRTIPQFMRRETPVVRITSKHTAYRIMLNKETGEDVEIAYPAGTVLYEGKAPFAAVGSVPFFGYELKMFPFAERKKGHMQLRVGDMNFVKVIANLFPKIWKGTFRDDSLFDFLVKDVTIEGSTAMNYQVGGDAAGTRERVSFSLDEDTWDITDFR